MKTSSSYEDLRGASMDNIGSLLKQKRLEMGLTIEDVSEKTRLTIKHIKAIEEGDISYFKDDLSYLRFFLKSYCDVLGLDFESIKGDLQDSIDDYTTSFTRDAIVQHEQIEKGIQETTEKIKQPKKSKPKKQKPKKAKRRRKIDMSLLSLLAIVVVILIGLIFAFVMWFQGSQNSEDDVNANKPPIPVVTNTQDPEPTIPEPQPEPEKKEMIITKASEDSSTAVYTIENLTAEDDIEIEINLGSSSSFRALVDTKELSDPARGTYAYKTVLRVREKAVANKKIQLAFGFMQNNAIKVNGKDLEIPAALLNKQGSAIIELNVKGEQ